MKRLIPILCTAILTTGVVCAAENKNQATQPDNSAMNQRDRQATAPTAQSQGGSEADRNLTAKIRRAVMDDDQLSGYAKNVKIITRDGRVTLRGPVRNEQEKAAIAKKAHEVAGRQEIDNQIEIAPGGSNQNQHEQKNQRKNQ